MSDERWRRVKALFQAAVERPAEERAAFLAGADEALGREVESLLAADAADQSFLEHLLAAPGEIESVTLETDSLLFAGDERADASVVGRRIGAYRIVEEIGRGGMGAAYLAERADGAYQKRVAIKLIKRGMDTEAIVRRFHRERQILAGLEHPHIAALLDGGTTEDGLPYFVMEYVEGQPIDAFCDVRHLSIANRLALFVAVCGAVHHAHQHQVVHRDLKPGNILVTATGTPKLLDFGIARLLNPPEPTQTVDVTGWRAPFTPRYASPEQMRGDLVLPSSDVYSLGVLLYELLAGRPPYRLEGRTPAEVERLVCNARPQRPSAAIDAAAAASRGVPLHVLRRELAGGLDRVTLTALAKEPARRYADAKALADDIERHMAGLPLAAPRAGVGSRAATLVRRHARRVFAAAAVCAIAAALVLGERVARHPPPAPEDVPITSLAVLLLANDSGDPDLDYLSEGLTEDLIRRLARLPALKVIARDSVYRYKGRDIDPQVIGRELNVQAILTGRMIKRGHDVSIRAELVDARDRSFLWGDQYDRRMSDLHGVQRELAGDIAGGLRLQFSGDERARLTREGVADPEAYEAYLKGRYHWNRRTAADLRKSAAYFTQSVDRDPSFALAWSALSDAYGLLAEYRSAPPAESYREAKRAAARALAIDSELAEAHASLGYIRQYFEWDWAGAEAEFRRAIDLNPSYATAHQWYAEYLSAMGRHEEALSEIQRARQLDPLSLIVNSVEALILHWARRYDEAIEQSQKVIDLDANFPEVYEYLKRSYDQKGAWPQAIAARQQRRMLLGLDARMTPTLRAAAGARSSRDYWQHRLAQELQESPAEGSEPFELAEIFAQIGDRTRALDWLERACDEPDFMVRFARVAPNLDPLRNEPRFKALVDRSCGTPVVQ